MIDLIFYFCVDLLRVSAQMLGTTYEAVNVWLFVVILPLALLLSGLLNIFLLGKVSNRNINRKEVIRLTKQKNNIKI